MTLLKNDTSLLPLGRDVAKIAVIGPHADSTVVGFPAYTYPAALQQLRGRARGFGETSMAGVGGEGASLPPDVMAAMKAELKDVVDVDMEDFVKSSYSAVSLAEAVRRLLPNATVTAPAIPGRHQHRDRRGTLYAADTAAGVTLPAHQLVGFARVDLEPRASKTVGFVVPMSLLRYTGRTGRFILEPVRWR